MKKYELKNISKNPFKLGFAVSILLKKYAIISVICVLGAASLARFVVVILKNLTDALTANPMNFEQVLFWTMIFPIIFLIEEGLWRISGFMGISWFMKMRSVIYQSLYEYVTLHSKDYFNNRLSGTITNKINNAVDGIESLFENMLWQFVPLFFGSILFIIFSFSNDFRLGLIIILWSLIFVLINIFFAQKLKSASVKNAKADSALKGRVVDSLSNISLVHEYAYIAGEQEYINNYINKSYIAGVKHWKLSEWMLTINAFLIFIFICLMLFTSIYLFREGIVTAGVIVMVIAITMDLSRQLLFLGQQFRNSAKLFGDAQEGLTEILQAHEVKDAENATELVITNPSIEIKDIAFEYHKNEVFRDFSLNVPAGQKLGLVGRSGAGKSTFISLLLRHYDLKKGQIQISGTDISRVTLNSLRKNIGYVPQDTSLFHRSIKENIGYSNPDADFAEIINAAKLAYADEFIKNLSSGYETLVGERGVKLSGGQRQRIAIARAFLKNAPILLLDEATSSLDSESEKAIQESLVTLMKGRTVIAIAHRLSTLKNMDRIIVLENGKIAEDGKPNELLDKNNSLFKKLWDHQVKGFILDE